MIILCYTFNNTSLIFFYNHKNIMSCKFTNLNYATSEASSRKLMFILKQLKIQKSKFTFGIVGGSNLLV